MTKPLIELCPNCAREWEIAILANLLMDKDPNFPANFKEGTTEEYYVKARRILQGETEGQVENLDTEV